ncbi:hypothetical protein [Streptococcus sanguinis]|uniref:hypothetical protein n=1 Tax=Streptococcus sanguinis TaxID=1305 RepID=UPI0007793366|nr:hypothetical protein [Streptococcus sanguinis]
MPIVLFKNRLDGNMKRFGSFLKEIQKKSIRRQNISLISGDKKRDYLSNIDSSGTNIFVCHGSKDSLYHRFHCSPKQVLLDTTTKLSLGKVIAVSCGTGRSLGKELVKNGNCKVYLGFNTKLHFDKRNSQQTYISPYYSQYLKEFYKEVFEDVLIKAIDSSWTFEKTRRVLEWELRKESVFKAQIKKVEYPHFYKTKEINQTVVAVTSVAKNIVIHGNGDEKVE